MAFIQHVAVLILPLAAAYGVTQMVLNRRETAGRRFTMASTVKRKQDNDKK
ncbi:hypothetical protein [Ramlibacter alkalitolerans]|uniref:Uncharacterized protein n=1 Tax=Ramlibacter alkalitolerans TaxID=2039631 RepID=A0ABS1JU97_9BURK|nr:hypothetical protein [Ramlibacter alkalitolerans]MBL0427853.1 hypothetical protein [Ramlibacter alkalitolerans]